MIPERFGKRRIPLVASEGGGRVSNTQTAADDRDSKSSLGVAGAVVGVVVLIGAAGIAASVYFNPPDWLRIVTFWAFLLGLPVSILLNVQGLRARRRTPAIIGFALCTVAVAAMVALQMAVG